MTHPAYGELRAVSDAASVLLENNPSTMTLEGTNTWVLGAPGATGRVVVDPGYEDSEHLDRLAAVGDVELVLLTHHHPDHAEGAPAFAERVGAPVRALDPALCVGAGAFDHDDVISVAGLELHVLHTPGHTRDSVTLRFDHAGRTHVLTGDTILGRGTTVLTDLGDYLSSLRLLRELPPGSLGLPGHGPELADLAATARAYSEHREQRLDQVRAALRRLGPGATARQIVEVVYADVDRALWAPAEASVEAQLAYLRAQGG
ncbi:glyoxylase-like metal-dependent hydrolase (beta-lactamase superfamily II) [Prauserella shujinwangii]|uniref:Glyoxylase-like metal-dependent hydrolase (Beta-lactamase superfamily II) n=1 Tax=Prauserella shujinwangii TaxID=1453103 RepID=A0A2T0LNL4_9PSEU|nr:MBL fold metallo-hydrolase [Prauserella shujinwangii]PRX44770.1 glyoxylase-like metal-dependent hydrolase (beta-lactamase superfamily II) [Prauserella shujinwangii]